MDSSNPGVSDLQILIIVIIFTDSSLHFMVRFLCSWRKRLVTRVFIFLLVFYASSVCLVSQGCRKPQAVFVTSDQTTYSNVPEPLDYAWVMSSEWAGYMGVALALSSNQYYYWFYSDVVTDDEPVYPVVGKFTLENNMLTLLGTERDLYSLKWVLTTNANRACLWATTSSWGILQSGCAIGICSKIRPSDCGLTVPIKSTWGAVKHISKMCNPFFTHHPSPITIYL